MPYLVLNANSTINVVKGIYLMRAYSIGTNPEGKEEELVVRENINNLLRFGVIGLHERFNNASNRLSQANAGWRQKNTANFKGKNLRWAYLNLICLDRDTPPNLLRNHENTLRHSIRHQDDFLFINRMDAFTSRLNLSDISKIYMNIIHNELNLIF